MSKKITELPTSTAVEPAFYVPLVNTTNPTGNTTEKAPLTMVAQGLNGLVATLTGSFFTGPVTASLGLSASFINLGGSGNTRPNVGALRLPYNNGVSDRIITAKYFDNTSDVDFLTYGGTTWTIGSTGCNVFTYAAAMLNFSQASISNYHYSGWTLYNQVRGAYDLSIDGNGALFTVPVTSSNYVTAGGISGNHKTIIGPLVGSPSGYGAIYCLASSSSPSLSNPVIYSDGASCYLNSPSGAGSIGIVAGGASVLASFNTTQATLSTQVTASNGMWIGGNNTVTFAHSGSTVEQYDASLRRTIVKSRTPMTSSGTKILTSFTGSNGYTYLVKIDVVMQHSTTTGSYVATYVSHYNMSSNSMNLVGSLTSVTSSNSLAPVTVSTSLTSAGSVIALSGTVGGAFGGGNYNFGTFMTVQEVG
jgi:hypothetical protein